MKVKMYVKVKKMSTKQRKGGEGEERNLGRGRDRVRNRYHDADDSYLKVLSKKLSATLRLQHGEPQYADGWHSPTFFFFQEGAHEHSAVVRPILIIHVSARRHCGP